MILQRELVLAGRAEAQSNFRRRVLWILRVLLWCVDCLVHDVRDRQIAVFDFRQRAQFARARPATRRAVGARGALLCATSAHDQCERAKEACRSQVPSERDESCCHARRLTSVARATLTRSSSPHVSCGNVRAHAVTRRTTSACNGSATEGTWWWGEGVLLGRAHASRTHELSAFGHYIMACACFYLLQHARRNKLRGVIPRSFIPRRRRQGRHSRR